MRAYVVVMSTVFSSILSGTPIAADLTIKPRLDAGLMYYEYDQDDFTITSPSGAQTTSGWNVSDFLPLIGGGVTLNYDRVFLDLYGQVTAQGHDSDSQTVINSSAAFGDRLLFDSEFNRYEAGASVGYRITDAFILFGGYRYAKVKFENNVNATTGVSGLPPSGAPFLGTIDINFIYHGPYAGISYGIPTESLRGTLLFTSAFTYLFGNIDQDFNPAPGSNPSLFEGDADGETLGYNFGISWTGQITDEVSYTFLIDTSRYSFDNDDSKGADFSENVYRLRASVGYSFNTGSLF